VSIPTSKTEAVTTLMSDIKILKSKAALLAEQKIPADEYFRDLAIFEQFWVGVLAGYVEEQLQRVEGYKKVLERLQSINSRLGKPVDPPQTGDTL
jgi:hypothetical protein